MNNSNGAPKTQASTTHVSNKLAVPAAVPAGRTRRRASLPLPPNRQRAIERVLERLPDARESSPGQWSARCPAHGDQNPSLSINEASDGKVLLWCHTGCSLSEIVAALELREADLFPSPQRSARNGQSHHATNGTQVAGRPTSHLPEPTAANLNRGAPETRDGEQLKTAPGTEVIWARRAEQYERACTPEHLGDLESELGLPAIALRALRVGYSSKREVYTFPEFDGSAQVIGISTRTLDGIKRMLTGSRRGLYLPTGWLEREGPIYVAEGATCTAALTAMGLAGIGRPSAAGGAELLADLLSDLPADRAIIVLGEFDPKQDGAWPGKAGAITVARKLSNALMRPVRWGLPPEGAKDVREWLRNQQQDNHDEDQL